MRYIDKTINDKANIFDNAKSVLANREIDIYRSEITKQKNSPVCLCYSTFEVTNTGAEAITKDDFYLTKEQFDV